MIWIFEMSIVLTASHHLTMKNMEAHPETITWELGAKLDVGHKQGK